MFTCALDLHFEPSQVDVLDPYDGGFVVLLVALFVVRGADDDGVEQGERKVHVPPVVVDVVEGNREEEGRD